jgi:acyl-coenzyme A thioesterase PaaI-like protein
MSFKDTIFVRYFGLTKVPLIFWVRPKVLELNDEKTIVEIPFLRRNKNHLGSMYFGVLCTGADIGGGIAAMREIHNSGRKISLAFKDFKAEFHKRAEGPTHFVNDQGPEIKKFIQRVIESKERENMAVEIKAYTPSKLGDEPVASFTLTLSCKLKGS